MFKSELPSTIAGGAMRYDYGLSPYSVLWYTCMEPRMQVADVMHTPMMLPISGSRIPDACSDLKLNPWVRGRIYGL